MLLLNVLLLLLSCGICEKIDDNNDGLVVSLDEGDVRGKWIATWGGKRVRAFLGMRYAKAPIGNLRFKDPEEVEHWKGIKNALKDGPPCVQFKYIYEGNTKELIGEEDCLYINVFVPQTTKEKLPVLIHIHGGFLVFGSSDSRNVGPEILQDYCDFILVTMNYRLSVMGFLSLGNEEARGNFGFKDQVAALKWVNRNIKHFGGDPNKVTLMGHSAGSTSVGYHVHSEMSKGLFHRAILASSAMDSHRATSASFAKDTTLQLVKLLDCPMRNNSLIMNCLRYKSIHDIYNNLKHLKVWRNEPFLVFRPTLETGCEKNCFITEQSVKSKSTVPLILGYNSEDGYVVSENIILKPELIAEVNDNFDQIVPLILRYDQHEDRDEITKAIKEFYLKNADLNPKNFMNFTHMCGDVLYWRADLKELLIGHDGPALVYYYTHRGTLTFLHDKTLKGVTHGDEQLLIYPYQAQFGEHRISEEDKQTSAKFSSLIAGFTEHGTSYPGWKNFDSCKMNYLHIGTNEYSMKDKMLGDRSTFWKDWLLDNTHDHKCPAYQEK